MKPNGPIRVSQSNVGRIKNQSDQKSRSDPIEHCLPVRTAGLTGAERKINHFKKTLSRPPRPPIVLRFYGLHRKTISPSYLRIGQRIPCRRPLSSTSTQSSDSTKWLKSSSWALTAASSSSTKSPSSPRSTRRVLSQLSLTKRESCLSFSDSGFAFNHQVEDYPKGSGNPSHPP